MRAVIHRPAPFSNRHVSPAVRVLVVASGLTVGCASVQAERIVDGETQRGVVFEPATYGAVVAAARADASDDLEHAADGWDVARTGATPNAAILAEAAWVEARRGRDERAARMLDAAALRDPDALALWIVRGRIAERDEAFEIAEAAYAHAALLHPRAAAGPLAHAASLSRRGERAEALRVLTAYVMRAPVEGRGATLALRALGQTLVTDTEAAAALPAFDRHGGLGDAVRREAAQDFAARGAHAVYLVLQREWHLDRAGAVRALIEEGRTEEAVALARRMPATDLASTLSKVDALLYAGDLEVAEGDARRAALRWPSHALTIRIATARAARGDRDGAVAALDRLPAGSSVADAAAYLRARIDGATPLPDPPPNAEYLSAVAAL